MKGLIEGITMTLSENWRHVKLIMCVVIAFCLLVNWLWLAVAVLLFDQIFQCKSFYMNHNPEPDEPVTDVPPLVPVEPEPEPEPETNNQATSRPVS